MSTPDRSPGWDKRAVNRIAKEQYGGLRAMFDAHGWSTDGRVISQMAPTRVTETYGSVAAFEAAHNSGLDGNPVLNPVAAIKRNPPDVWLTSYYGFNPETWGLVTFTKPEDRSKFIDNSVPGTLIVIYGTKDLSPDQAGRILGVQQVSHRIGPSQNFIEPTRWKIKQHEHPDSWNYGVQCLRAWKLPEEFRPLVDDFASETYSYADARTIGRRGKRLTRNEARKLLKLPFVEVPVYGGRAVDVLGPQKGEDVFTPSRAGPVSQTPHLVREAEGPKHLYILRLHGDTDNFLGYRAKGQMILKVGISASPGTRCDALNRALPEGAFKWHIERSTHRDGLPPFPTSAHAIAGEDAMKAFLHREGRSLGGEFFLSAHDLAMRAWDEGVQAAQGWKGSQ